VVGVSQTEHDALVTAVADAVRAPSIFNTQPWSWRIHAASLELRADRSRWLEATDPDGTELLLSCGAALHHARVSLAASGWVVHVERMHPDDVLARVCLTGRSGADPNAVALHHAIGERRTDRRPYSDRPVPPEILERLATASTDESVSLHHVRLSQMPMLSIAVAAAAAAELTDPAYLSELMRWTNRPEWSKDGVPADTAVRHVARRVPVREFALPPREGIEVDPGGDLGAAYLILYGHQTAPGDWLRAGEALSAVLLTAVSRGLAVAPLTDVLEVEHPRGLIRGLVPPGNEPYVLVRCGYPADPTPLPASPRRTVADIVDNGLST
jgi:nitroreductase